MAYQFKIKLEETSKPPVWRRLLMPENYTFAQLHMAIQGAFGWENAHLFRFHDGYDGDISIGIPYDGGFGDSWERTLTLEKDYIRLYPFGEVAY